jgi:tRNA-modifying protein YgfZ
MARLRTNLANSMSSECKSVPLETLGVLRVSGPDAVSFLQGQLSNDMTRLAAAYALLAGYHNPQGRVIALLRVLRLAPDELLAVLPRELIAPVAQRLGRFILRAKVKLADDSAQWTICGVMQCAAADVRRARTADAAATAPALLAELPATLNGATRIEASLAVRVAHQPARWLLVSPAAQSSDPPLLRDCSTAGVELWERSAVAAGEPEVYTATSGEFVAQMLNLDVLDAIAFDKGCYTGQEIIARAHFRGRVKRRLQRFLTDERTQLRPGESGVLSDGRSFKVVRAVARPDGKCEFLAVTASVTAPGERELAGGPGTAGTPQGAEPLAAEQLELPYSWPE